MVNNYGQLKNSYLVVDSACAFKSIRKTVRVCFNYTHYPGNIFIYERLYKKHIRASWDNLSSSRRGGADTNLEKSRCLA